MQYFYFNKLTIYVVYKLKTLFWVVINNLSESLLEGMICSMHGIHGSKALMIFSISLVNF